MFFFFNDTATTEISTLPLPDALPISRQVPGLVSEHRDRERAGEAEARRDRHRALRDVDVAAAQQVPGTHRQHRSEEHTSELQSQSNLVCRLLLEKKKNET